MVALYIQTGRIPLRVHCFLLALSHLKHLLGLEQIFTPVPLLIVLLNSTASVKYFRPKILLRLRELPFDRSELVLTLLAFIEGIEDFAKLVHKLNLKWLEGELDSFPKLYLLHVRRETQKGKPPAQLLERFPVLISPVPQRYFGSTAACAANATCFVHRENSWKPVFMSWTVPCNATYLPTYLPTPTPLSCSPPAASSRRLSIATTYNALLPTFCPPLSSPSAVISVPYTFLTATLSISIPARQLRPARTTSPYCLPAVLGKSGIEFIAYLRINSALESASKVKSRIEGDLGGALEPNPPQRREIERYRRWVNEIKRTPRTIELGIEVRDKISRCSCHSEEVRVSGGTIIQTIEHFKQELKPRYDGDEIRGRAGRAECIPPRCPSANSTRGIKLVDLWMGWDGKDAITTSLESNQTRVGRSFGFKLKLNGRSSAEYPWSVVSGHRKADCGVQLLVTWNLKLTHLEVAKLTWILKLMLQNEKVSRTFIQ
ncbi:hypothetical protein B0H16DRAFT_1807588 [Mycena metata]|uniref:Uncharacterized protein n=1 Tax=Mycena metata TaxID=1033252 RepID=A0AAD7H7Y5_9AGAR|nr:hypothetical protein B0H16DRAFT_1807588 [Mycena metata]